MITHILTELTNPLTRSMRQGARASHMPSAESARFTLVTCCIPALHICHVSHLVCSRRSGRSPITTWPPASATHPCGREPPYCDTAPPQNTRIWRSIRQTRLTHGEHTAREHPAWPSSLSWAGACSNRWTCLSLLFILVRVTASVCRDAGATSAHPWAACNWCLGRRMGCRNGKEAQSSTSGEMRRRRAHTWHPRICEFHGLGPQQAQAGGHAPTGQDGQGR